MVSVAFNNRCVQFAHNIKSKAAESDIYLRILVYKLKPIGNVIRR